MRMKPMRATSSSRKSVLPQSGEIDRERGISKCGDSGIRWALVEAAGVLLRLSKRSSPLKSWGLSIARRRGMPKATVAVARRLAIILHRMWVDNTTLSLGGDRRLRDWVQSSASVWLLFEVGEPLHDRVGWRGIPIFFRTASRTDVQPRLEIAYPLVPGGTSIRAAPWRGLVITRSVLKDQPQSWCL